MKSASIEAGLLVNGTPYPAALWSLDRRFCVFNPLVNELLGYSEQEISHHPELYIDRIHPEDRAIFLLAWHKVCGGAKSASCQYRFTPKHGGEARTIRENSLLFPIPGSKVQGALTLYTEERKETEKIAEAHQLRSLLRGLSHEIGNSLQAISGELELLKWSGTLPPESAAIVSSAIMQIRALTGDVEEYFFPLSGENGNSDLPSVIAKAMHESGEKTNANAIRSKLIIKGTLPSVPLDNRLGKTLKAVIDFSCALLAGGGELKIEIGTCRRDGCHYIELNVISYCRDALPVEEDRVFHPFIHVGGYRPGLSMTVAQRVLWQQSGEIVFRKEQANRGVFSVLIPVPDRAA